MNQIDKLSKTVGLLSVDAVEKAQSGHPGLPLGAAYATSILWSDFLNFDPIDPRWINRDRFVLSAGHGSALLYSLLHLFGFGLSLEDLKQFRQWQSITPGHPEFGMTPGVEATTGPLGQGFANGVGMALSGKLLNTYCPLINYRVFGLISDGDIMEGISAEAASLAGHLKLGNLIYLYDDNEVTLAGDANECFSEDVSARFKASGWQVQSVNGYDYNEIKVAITDAINNQNQPSLISIKSIIGFGSPNKSGSFKSHGSPLGASEVKLIKESWGWPTDKEFYVPDDVAEYCKNKVEHKRENKNNWSVTFEKWCNNNVENAKKLNSIINRSIPANLKEELLKSAVHDKDEATRIISEKVLQVAAKNIPALIVGSADLETSTKTVIKGSPDIQAGEFIGRNIRYGVREHAMGGIANGLSYEGSWLPLVSTFLVFSDYMRAPIRLAALSHTPVVFVFTHDSIWVGEDGPTHEPVEQLQSLRLIPNLKVFRPADGVETAMSYYVALTRTSGPTCIICTRHNLPSIKQEINFNPDMVLLGAYVVREEKLSPNVTLVATGSELSVALIAKDLLLEHGIKARVVSMPCIELFLEQSKEYRNAILPPTIPSVSIEAGRTSGWAQILGPVSLSIGIETFGASAPGEVLAEKYGLLPESIASKVRDFVQKL
jgi:transketolase